MSSIEERLFDTRAEIASEITKQDISIRISQVVNYEKLLWRAYHFKNADPKEILPYFLEEWFGLYRLAFEFLKSDKKENKKQYEDFFENPYVLQRIGNEIRINYDKTIKRALRVNKMFFRDLKVAGLLDLRSFTIKPRYAFKESI